jgi:hypothetical protein
LQTAVFESKIRALERTLKGEHMKKLSRILVLTAALVLVSLAAADAYPVYDRCYYVCGDLVLEGYATYGGCCSYGGNELSCPNGASPQGISWGGYTTLEQLCN